MLTRSPTLTSTHACGLGVENESSVHYDPVVPHLVFFAFSISLLLGCSSGPRATRDAAPDATLSPDAGMDVGMPIDAARPPDVGTLPPDTCEVRVSIDHRAECRDACDARLLIVSGAHYCTFQCTDDAECAPQGLDCIEQMGGVCAPRCEDDSDCPEGFFRCDPVGGFCDTYPVEG